MTGIKPRARRGGGCHSGPPQLAALPHTDRARTARQSSASPGLNRVFRLLPQRLEVLLHQWPRPTDLPRARCVGSRLDSTPGNGVEPRWNATIRTTRGVGRLFDSLKLSAWQLAPSWLPHCRGRWPDSGKQGRAPLLSGPTVPEEVWRSSTLTPLRHPRYGPPKLAGPTWCSGPTVQGPPSRPRPPAKGSSGTTVAPPPGWRGRRIRASSTRSLPLTAISPQCSKPLSPKVLVRARRS